MASRRTVSGKCHRCGVETEHDIVAMYTDNVGFGFGMECPLCGYLVPEPAWLKYQKTGNVIVPNMFRNERIHKKATKEYM